ncbi:MAG: response regulator transcription factor [Legionella sp.]|nr:MAG: response regulator transcription factor [Legionella sp.]
MLHHHYLLFIDDAPLAADLIDYFLKFNLEIKQQRFVHPINLDAGIPEAILIRWSVIKNDGDLIQHMYNTYATPIIIIHDTPDEDLCIHVLERGADDFICQPLYPRELHARINAIRRRVDRTQQKINQTREIFHFANWKLIPSARRLFDLNHQEQHLSSGEYELLFIFVQKSQQILDRELLLQLTKNSDLSPFDRRIDVQISRLRQKIEVDAKKPQLIKTIRNGGYMFTSKVIRIKEKE